MTVGFIGTGAIAAAVIEGLCLEQPPKIIVSPRSETISRDLAARLETVRRAESNHEVAGSADIVCLGVRPKQLGPLLEGLPFRDGQIVVSFVFGAAPKDIARQIAADVTVCQAVPLPTAARREGPLLLHPAPPAVRTLFAPLGVLIEPESQAEMQAYALGGAQMSSFFALALEAMEGLTADGASRGGARDYIMSMYGALASAGLATPVDQLVDLPGRHETPGGVNEACRKRLEALGWLSNYRDALDAVRARAASMVD